jgi:glycosyltransferase involved in cell wall biosynthesis
MGQADRNRARKTARAGRPSILAIVPAYNEASAIGGVVRELRAVRPNLDVLVVDDGSKDGTAGAAARAGARVVTLPFNLGIGGAVQTGFMYAMEHGYDMAVQVDGDGQHIPSQIPILVSALESRRADVVIGSRFLDATRGYTTSSLRRVGVRIFTRVNSLLVRKRITDNTSGFRVFNRRALAFLSESYPQDYPEPESVVLLGRNGFVLEEVAVLMRERGTGKSSISALRSVYYMVKVLLAIFIDVFKTSNPREA